MKNIKIITIMVMMLVLSACSKTGSDDSVYKGMTAAQLYNSAEKSLVKDDYSVAIKHFEALEAMYPFSDYSQQAERNLIYAYYKNGEMAAASSTAERYIHLYPSSQDVDYAYYMKGLADFNQERGVFAQVFPMDVSYRDPGSQKQAYTDFQTLIHQYPNSQYAADARQRSVYLRNNFAKKELNIAKFYFKRKMYVAAANRASYVIRTYPQSPQTEAALVIVVKANRQLGFTQTANEALKVLRSTYPNSRRLQELS